MLRVIREYLKWRKKWDDLCYRCGLCCYGRSVSGTGEVVVDFSSSCKFLNKETRLCNIFKDRLKRHGNCSSVNIFRALFHPYLPSGCAYVKTFRFWKNKESNPANT